MGDYEKLGAFYLGKEYDLAKKQLGEKLVLYDSKDLVTHGVCVGMTGSGKTGLCMALLEEAAIDGIPSIIIDPKGDLGNLLLAFPDLQGKDFAPWINEQEAQKKGLSTAEYANSQAEFWRKGLSDWGQDGERIRKMCSSVEHVVYTPGSNAGIPISIIKSFDAPSAAVMADNELFQERVTVTVSSLLGLLGIESDPLQGREHLLLATILNAAWREGKNLDIESIIRLIQTPPFSKVGVLDLETFYPSKDRFGLVMTMNGLLASPTFGMWTAGDPLDIDKILYTPAGKPKVSIFYIAHLSDAERMFFVSTLLNQVVSWMRTQPGTSSLRAILYMDEIFGYFPPVANPPSKRPMLTLLKQARAFGVGILLATQNPVDLDYRGLSNTGTWFIGRLQTERDKQRLLDGLEGVAASSGDSFDRSTLDRMISDLSQRVFLLNNTHEDEPEVFQTRWVMSYMRGPLTRDHIKTLMSSRKTEPLKPSANMVTSVKPGSSRPTLVPEISEYFMPVHGNANGRQMVYKPAILGHAKISFSDRKYKIDTTQEITEFAWVTDGVIPVNWEVSEEFKLPVTSLDKLPAANAQFAELPAIAADPKRYPDWEKDLATWLANSKAITLIKSQSTGAISRPLESEREFTIRIQQLHREKRDEEIEKIRRKYASRIAALQERVRKAYQVIEREREKASAAKRQAAVSFGTSLLTAFLGRKATRSSLSGASTGMRGIGRSMQERKDVERAAENAEALQGQLDELESELREQVTDAESRFGSEQENMEQIRITPSKSDVSIRIFGLAWAPFWKESDTTATPAWKV